MYFTNLCPSEIARVVQDDLNRVVQWIESSRLILDQSKTISMPFGSWKNLAKSPNFCIQLYGKTLERVAEFSYLGVVLDEGLSWKDHVDYVSSKVSRRQGLLSRIRSRLTLEASKQYKLHSCSHYLTMLMLRGGNLRGVLQRVTPPIEPCSSNYITEEHVKWNFLCAKMVKSSFHKCILVFKCLNNLVPKYLTQYFTMNTMCLF